MNIHFASLFCVDFDCDLLSHWVRYYLAMNFDSYTVWLNTQKSRTDLVESSRDYLRNRGINVHITDGEFNDGQLRMETLSGYAKSLDKSDRLVTVDSDEFHCIDKDMCLGCDIVPGVMLDRYDRTLHDAVENQSIDTQYPIEGNVQEQVIASIPGAAGRFWPRVNRNKICCARADLPVAFGGSHTLYLDKMLGGLTCSPKVHVQHYSFRESLLRRMAGKHYYDAACMWYIWKFFGGTPGREPPELLDKIKEDERLQESKGWIPAYA